MGLVTHKTIQLWLYWKPNAGRIRKNRGWRTPRTRGAAKNRKRGFFKTYSFIVRNLLKSHSFEIFELVRLGRRGFSQKFYWRIKIKKRGGDIKAKRRGRIETKRVRRIETKRRGRIETKRVRRIETKRRGRKETKRVRRIKTKRRRIKTKRRRRIETKRRGRIKTKRIGRIKTKRLRIETKRLRIKPRRSIKTKRLRINTKPP